MNTICGVLDMDGFHVMGEFLTRECGFVGITWNEGESVKFNLSPFKSKLSKNDWRTVRYVEKNVIGMSFSPHKEEKVYSLKTLDSKIFEWYAKAQTSTRYIVAYKGGCIEKQHLNKLGIPNVNLEIFGCPKYNILKENYQGNSCGFHKKNLHCPKVEVEAFRKWVVENSN